MFESSSTFDPRAVLAAIARRSPGGTLVISAQRRFLSRPSSAPTGPSSARWSMSLFQRTTFAGFEASGF
jgi:hypothetical protein